MDDVPAEEIVELAAYFNIRERDRKDDTADRQLEAMREENAREGTYSGPPVIGRDYRT